MVTGGHEMRPGRCTHVMSNSRSSCLAPQLGVFVLEPKSEFHH
jgi:hypothetical protein